MTEEAKASNEPKATEPAQQEPSEAPQPTQNDQSQGKPQQAPAKEDKWEFNGNFDKLKEEKPELYKYATGIRRYLTTKEQDYSKSVKSAQEYEQIRQSPVWNEFLNYYQNKQNAPQQSAQEETYIDPDTQKYVESKEQLILNELKNVKDELGKVKKESEIALFADSHPKFWEYDEIGLIRPLLREGKSLSEAYTQAEGIVSKLRKEQVQLNNQRVQEKMNAANTVGPSISNDSDTVWVDHPNDVLTAATELAMQGIKNKKVRVRRK